MKVDQDSNKKYLTEYAVLGGGIAAMGVGGAAQAALMTHDPADLTITRGTANETIFFDLDNSGGGTLASFSSFAGADFSIGVGAADSLDEKPTLRTIGGGAGGSPSGVLGAVVMNREAARLAVGGSVGTADNPAFLTAQGGMSDPDFTSYIEYSGTGPWATGGDGYLGLRLDAGAGNFNYGWARINYDDANDAVTLFEFAYQSTVNADADISTNTGPGPGPGPSPGTAPVPGTLALLALGAPGLMAVRRRRRTLDA